MCGGCWRVWQGASPGPHPGLCSGGLAGGVSRPTPGGCWGAGWGQCPGPHPGVSRPRLVEG